MSPSVPEEVDVFSVPHSRMKELVDEYFLRVCIFPFCSNLPTLGYLISVSIRLVFCDIFGKRYAYYSPFERRYAYLVPKK